MRQTPNGTTDHAYAGIPRRSFLQAISVTALASAGLNAQAAGFTPTKQVKLIVPYPPGGAVDLIARMVAPKLQEHWGQSVVIENLTGASGIIGAQHVQRQPPDGHTLLITISNTHAILPHMQPMPFDPFKDFSGIVTLVRAQTGLFVRTGIAETLSDFFSYARSLKDPMPFGDWGVGSFGQMLIAALAINENFRVNNIHYRGAAPIVQAVLSGEIPAGSADVSSVQPFVQAGKVKMLAVNGTARHPTMSDVPTFNELGIDEFDSFSWIGVYGPPGMTMALRESVAQSFQQVTLEKDMQQKIQARGFLTAVSDPAKFQLEWRGTYDRFGKLVKKTGIKAE